MTKKQKQQVEKILSETPKNTDEVLAGFAKEASENATTVAEVVAHQTEELPQNDAKGQPSLDEQVENQKILNKVSHDLSNHNPEIVDMPTQEEQPTEEMQNVPVQVVTVFRCVKAMDQMGLGTNIVMALKASPDYQTSVRPGSVGNLSISTVSPGFNGWFEEGKLYRVTIQPLE